MISLPSNPFVVAERYIQLRKVCVPDSWADTVTLFNDMILMPLITLFLLFVGLGDPIVLFTTTVKTYQVWKDYCEYTDLRFQVQQMFFVCQATGGPFIVTNDPTYMPYVFADAVVRKNEGLLIK
jgi:hypothetical protein